MTKENQRIAALVREDAKRYLETYLGDPDLDKMVRRDAKDLRAVAKMVREGRIREARNAYYMLDTIVRNSICEEAYDFLTD